MRVAAVFGAAFACVLAVASPAAGAHDTWLALRETPSPGLATLALSTGKQFPLQESGHTSNGIARSGCVDAAGAALALRPRAEEEKALLLRVRTGRTGALALSCWIETRPLQVELTPPEIDEYLAEIQAAPDIVARWHALRQQGARWRETYSKTARFEHLADAAAAADGLPPGTLARLRQPSGRALEIVLLGEEAVRVGAPLSAQVLEDGQPVAGLPVQLVSERFPLGFWRRSDARGQLHYPALPFAGRWLLRATRLVPPASAADEWKSRFSTLLLQPLPAP